MTTVLFPPLQLTTAVRRDRDDPRALAGPCRHRRRLRARRGAHAGRLGASCAAIWRPRSTGCAPAEGLVERARQANPRAQRWGGSAASIREQSRALDRVAVLVDDLTTLVVEFQPHRRGIDRIDGGTGWVVADALDGLARVVCTPFPVDRTRTARDRARRRDRRRRRGAPELTTLLRTSEVPDDEGFFALGAVTIGMYRSLDTLRTRPLRPPGLTARPQRAGGSTAEPIRAVLHLPAWSPDLVAALRGHTQVLDGLRHDGDLDDDYAPDALQMSNRLLDGDGPGTRAALSRRHRDGVRRRRARAGLCRRPGRGDRPDQHDGRGRHPRDHRGAVRGAAGHRHDGRPDQRPAPEGAVGGPLHRHAVGAVRRAVRRGGRGHDERVVGRRPDR